MPTFNDQLDQQDLQDLIKLYGEDYDIGRTDAGAWVATPKPRQADVLTSSHTDGLRFKLERAKAKRESLGP